jgi:serine phosphatase RsbU (regulator of sigma subunit)
MLLDGRDPAGVLEGLDTFAATVEGAFCATVVCAVIDRSAGEITYSRAGHPPPLVSGPTGSRWLDEAVSVPLAVDEGLARRNATATMGPHDVLVLYSDGLVERRGESIDVGLARLAEAVARSADGSVAALADGLVRDMVGDGSGDDVVVIVKRLQG